MPGKFEPPEIGNPNIAGLWIYTIQGMMQWTNPVNLRFDPSSPLEVGWAFVGTPGAAERRTVAGFTPMPITVVNLATSIPKPVDAKGVPIRQDPLPGQTGAGADPPISGYLPFAESGRIYLWGDGTLQGAIWFTIAGNSFFANPQQVSGRFRFNPNVTLPGAVAPTQQPIGGMSFAFDFAGTHFNWDYSFILVSNDEAQIITAGRLPRPATGSGTMKKAAWDSIPRLPVLRKKK